MHKNDVGLFPSISHRLDLRLFVVFVLYLLKLLASVDPLVKTSFGQSSYLSATLVLAWLLDFYASLLFSSTSIHLLLYPPISADPPQCAASPCCPPPRSASSATLAAPSHPRRGRTAAATAPSASAPPRGRRRRDAGTDKRQSFV